MIATIGTRGADRTGAEEVRGDERDGDQDAGADDRDPQRRDLGLHLPTAGTATDLDDDEREDRTRPRSSVPLLKPKSGPKSPQEAGADRAEGVRDGDRRSSCR